MIVVRILFPSLLPGHDVPPPPPIIAIHARCTMNLDDRFPTLPWDTLRKTVLCPKNLKHFPRSLIYAHTTHTTHTRVSSSTRAHAHTQPNTAYTFLVVRTPGVILQLGDKHTHT